MTDHINCIVSTYNKIKTQRGFYMGGIISPDQRACKCGGKFIKKTFRGANYFSCEKCDSDPAFFRVRRYLPGPFGEKGKTVEIRYDSNGKRLTSIQASHATMEYIDGLVSNNKFDPTEFMIKESNNMLIFENFINKKYLPFFERKLEKKTIKPSSMISKRGIIRLHLMPYFKNINIRNIGTSTMSAFIDQATFSESYVRLVMGELKTILNKAHEMELINRVPVFAKLKKPSLKDPEKFLTFSDQMKVVDHIDDEQYKIMIHILCLMAIRPSEVRAFKWEDWDLKNRKLWIKRHVTTGELVVPGRKANDDSHSIRITDEVMDVIKTMSMPLNQEEYMFKGKINQVVTHKCLSRAWNKAVKAAKLPHVDLYRGTKSSTLSQWLRFGHSKSDIAMVAGISEEMLSRYAQHNNESRDKVQDKILNK